MEYKWDLSEIFKSKNEFDKEVKACEEIIKKIEKYKGKIMSSSKSLYEVLSLNDKLGRKSEKLYVYAYLNYYSCMSDSKNKALTLKVDNLIENISLKLSFITPELLKSNLKLVKTYIKENEKLKEYKFDLESTFRYKSHVLDEYGENLIANATNAMGNVSDAYSALNNADVKFGFIKDEEGKLIELNHSNYSRLIKSSKREVRKDAFLMMHEFYKNHINTISSLYLGTIKENFFISKVRKYNSPLEKSLFNDKIDVILYNNLIKSIHKKLGLLHRYFEIKKKMLKVNELHLYDVYVSPKKEKSDDISIEEGIEIVCNALKPIGNEYVSDLKNGIESGWVDAFYREGKRSGAYSWGSYDTMPYMSMNYEGDFNSVSTLAHELGHSMHTYYSVKNQSYVNVGYPIFLAEIASTVNEILLNRYMTKNCKKSDKKRYILEFLESVRTTVFRQVMFAEFEMSIYDKYNNNVMITKDELVNSYYELNKKYFGSGVVVDEAIKYEWARIPHFYTPFYVYKYATGFMVALIIVDRLEKEHGFNKKYIDFLSSGGSDYPLNILKKLGIELNEDTFNSAFNIYEEYLNMLEEE